MLVLSRYTNERIVVDDKIIITIVEIRGNRVRIGIEAPDGVKVDRQEIYDKIKRVGFDTRNKFAEREHD